MSNSAVDYQLNPDDLRKRLASVRQRIEEASARSNRAASEVTLVAISKTHPTEVLKMAIDAGVTDLGENRVQEAEPKITELGRRASRWHLVGHLQSNKARRAVQLFDVIHSLDSNALAKRLDRLCEEEERAELPVLIQVDLAGEETKTGVSEAGLRSLAETIRDCRFLKLMGLMILPPYFESPEAVRPYFKKLRTLRDDLQQQDFFGNGMGELSMGMTHDFEIAIEEGATMIRVGTAIFGERERRAL